MSGLDRNTLWAGAFVDELARAIGFLAGPDSGLMTGAVVHFDQSIPGAGDPPVPN